MKKKKINKLDIIKILFLIIFILIGIIDFLIIKRINKLEDDLNSSELKCLGYYEKTLEILK